MFKSMRGLTNVSNKNLTQIKINAYDSFTILKFGKKTAEKLSTQLIQLVNTPPYNYLLKLVKS